MAQVTVVAKIVAKKESVEAVKEELLKLVGPTRSEEGCLDYRLHQDTTDPSIFVFYETWESQESLTRHTTTDHYRAYVTAISDLVQERVVNKLSVIA